VERRDRRPGDDLLTVAARIREPIDLVISDSSRVATLPAVCPEWLGDRSFNDAHGVNRADTA
jgi:hypothetical protein